MSWILAVCVVLLVGGLTRCFIMNARAINRDMNQRFDALRDRLEDEASSVMAHLLGTNEGPNVPRQPESTISRQYVSSESDHG